ncbi:MAG: CocE/NonD family hydrolase [Candidatus Aminicenantales bacterium]
MKPINLSRISRGIFQKKAGLREMICLLLLAVVLGIAGAVTAAAQARPPMTDEDKAKRWTVENELASLAVIERKVMIPMRDGVRIAADVYYPKDMSKKYPAIWVRTPYNFNFWDVANGVPRDMTAALTAIKRGYAYVDMQERGQFFAEGEWGVLGTPLTDGDDEVAWMIKQPWSNGRVGTTGCSSTAEWQLGVVARDIPGFAAFNVQGFGCGVGRMGPFYEQGNWYRGGAVMMYNINWFYTNEKPQHPMFPPNTSQEDLVRVSKSWDLAARFPPLDWAKTFQYLPVQDMLDAAGAPTKVFNSMIRRTPNDPAWYEGGLFHDSGRIDRPGLWFMSYYDIAIAANIEAFNFVRKTAKGEIGDQQWAVIAPVGHCGFTRATEHTIVGERDMGDARLNYQDIMYGFFDRFLKGEHSDVLAALPKITYYTMGMNKWQAADAWPPKGAVPMTFYLGSGGKANTLNGDGTLALKAPSADKPDGFTYDPMNPVPTHGGYRVTNNVGGVDGSYDQRTIEERPDVLVYSSEPFKEGLEVTGTMTPTLYVSSDCKDTDFTVKVIDVYPDGRAYTLDESIQRMRYREGYNKPPVWMEPGKVYKAAFLPLITSNYFEVGHRMRVEISSSSFPEYDRNLNTGGNNYDETKGVTAHNVVHHSKKYPSSLTVTVMKQPKK